MSNAPYTTQQTAYLILKLDKLRRAVSVSHRPSAKDETARERVQGMLMQADEIRSLLRGQAILNDVPVITSHKGD